MKNVLLTISLLLACIVAQAQPINSAQALQNAQDFLQGKGINMKSKSMRRAPSAKDTGELAPYYVFNLGDNEGFVIASGDDSAYPVLAYSDKGSMKLDSLPENVKYWLDFYKTGIEALKGLKTTGTKPRRLPATVVEPMLTTQWGQDHPFNLSCPVNQKGRRCATGCVATAMAQVMYYHRKNSTRQVMEDIPGYQETIDEDDGRITVDSVPKGTVIDWDNMLDDYGGSCTETQEQAVANLMLYCGASIRMSYSTKTSYAYTPDVAFVLPQYFDYDEDVRPKDRYLYEDAVWESMVYEELAKGNPIIYGGGHHAYVLDGCDADGYVHVNWGWEGEGDGYFLLTASGYTDELDGYSEGQHAIFGAVPNGAIPRLTTQSMTLSGAATVDGLSSMTTFPVSFTMTVANLTDSQHSFEQAMGLYKNGQLKSVLTTLDNIPNLAVNGTKTMNVSLNIDAALANGVYQLVPISKESGTEKWRKNDNYDQFLTLVIRNDKARIVVGVPPVEGDIITFASNKTKQVCVENWDVNGDGELSRQEAAAVTNLNNVFRSNKNIESFDEFQYFAGLTAIDNYAFYYSSLNTVIIPRNVVTIGEEAFYDSKLRSITIPAAVKEIGKNAFNRNNSLIDIQVESGNTCYDSRGDCHALMETATNTLLKGCKNTVIPDGTKVIGEGAFEACSGLTSISIPNSVTTIGANAFYYCYKLQSATIPESVTAIGEKAFSTCNALTSITIPKSIRTLAGSAFASCENLTSIRVDANNPYYDSRDNCNAVMEKTTNKLVAGCRNTIIPQSTESIGDYAFYGCRNLSSVIIPSKVTSIGNYAFSGCSNMCRIELPQGLETIGNNAFSGCSNMYRIEFPQGLETIGNNAFSNCSSIGRIQLPEGLKTIGESAFYNMEELTTVILPSTLTSIGKGAFSYCKNLVSVEARMTTPIDIETYTFTSQNIATLYVPQGCASSYRLANVWKRFKKIEEGSISNRDIIYFADMDVKHICIEHWDNDGDREISKEEAAAVTDLGDAFEQSSPLAIEEGNAEENFYHPRYFDELQYFTGLTSIGNYAFSYSDSLRHVTLPPQVQTIEDEAFYKCEKLQAIEFPTSVTKIGDQAFYECKSLTSLVFPEGVEVIDDHAFASCKGLVSVSLPESLTTLGSFAFSCCSNLASIRLPSKISTIQNYTFSSCKKLENVFIPENILSLKNGAFYECTGLKYVTIPSQVESIGKQAFDRCNALTTVVVKRPEPLAITKETFSNYAGATLYVPKGSRSAYMDADNWKLFGRIVELSGVRGDVNNDSKANVTDVTLLVNHILGNDGEGFIIGIADINDDGLITVTDVTALVNIILGLE